VLEIPTKNATQTIEAPARPARARGGRGGTRPRMPRPARPRAASERALRVLNVAVAVVGIAFTAPLMLVIAALVKLTSPGPIFFLQPRIGQDRRAVEEPGGTEDPRRRFDLGGKPFRIYKFRTMRADLSLRNVWAQRDDPRITPIGRVLRATRLDELPQLFNVLRGEMNVVGPRPEQPRIFLDLLDQIDGYRERQKVPPGITGWAQINCAYDQCVDDVRRKLAHDLEYIRRRSVAEDVRIMVRTLPVMLFRRGAI